MLCEPIRRDVGPDGRRPKTDRAPAAPRVPHVRQRPAPLARAHRINTPEAAGESIRPSAALLTAFSALAFIAGCENLRLPDPETVGNRVALDAARARWQATGIADYTFTLRRVRFCTTDFVGPARITVVNRAVTDILLLVASPSEPNLANFPTIEELFEVVADALDQDAAKLGVEHDPLLGFPTRIAIDYATAVDDDEITYELTSLQR